jgi:hypothetical protein
MEDQRSFSENLDILIKLLRKMKDKARLEHIPGLSVVNFDFFLDNYERMKGQISEQLLQQFGEPIKQMVAEMVEQLKEELSEMGESIDDILGEEAPAIGPAASPQREGQLTIGEIDEMLRKPGLPAEEIDRLLDLRSRAKGHS